MRHIFDPSCGFSLERDLGLIDPSIQEVESELAEAAKLAEIKKQVEGDSGRLEQKAAASPQLMERFLDLWAIRIRESDEPLIQAKALLYCALPYHRTRERAVSRAVRIGRTRRMTITLAATEDGVDLPFGTDRALLAWLQTRGYESGVVELTALQEYLRVFELQPSGREYMRLRASLRRLTGLSIVLEGGVQGREPIRRQFKILAPPSEDHGGPGIPPHRHPAGSGRLRVRLPLDSDFWHYLQASAVALPFDLLRGFRHRPKSWDFVAFALHRCAIAKSSSVVPWPDLVEQLGTVDHSPRRLRKSLAAALEEIRVVYPKFPARFLRGGGLSVEPWQRH